MKSTFTYLGLTVIPLLFITTSCEKEEVGLPSVSGTWQLHSVNKYAGSMITPVVTRYETGTFRFVDGTGSGTAQYIDNTLVLKGAWSAKKQRKGYYEDDGSRQNEPGAITELSVKFDDPQYTRKIDWNFSKLEFISAGRFIGVIIHDGYEYRYDFRRV